MQIVRENDLEFEDQDPLDLRDPDEGDREGEAERSRENEQTFALAGGFKRLEYRLSAAMRGLREREVKELRELRAELSKSQI